MGHLAAGTWRHGTKTAFTRGERERVFQVGHALCFPRISSGAYSDATIAARFSESAAYQNQGHILLHFIQVSIYIFLQGKS